MLPAVYRKRIFCYRRRRKEKIFYNALRQQERIKQFLHFIPRKKGEEGENQRLGQEIRELWEWLVKEMKETKPGWHQVTNGLTLRLLSCLMEHFSIQFVNQQRLKLSNIVYQEIVAYLREHYASVTRQEISGRFHYSEDFIGKMIKENAGMTFQQLLQKIRLERAVWLLQESTLPIDQIIYEVGYQNRGYFYQIFMKKYGCKPSVWRKEHG